MMPSRSIVSEASEDQTSSFKSRSAGSVCSSSLVTIVALRFLTVVLLLFVVVEDSEDVDKEEV